MMFGSRDSAELERLRSRLVRLERQMGLVMESLGLQLELDPIAETIQGELDAGRKIAAIKSLRGATGIGLAEAKRAVEDGSWLDLLAGGADDQM